MKDILADAGFFFIMIILMLCVVVGGSIAIVHEYLYIPYYIAAPSIILITLGLIAR